MKEYIKEIPSRIQYLVRSPFKHFIQVSMPVMDIHNMSRNGIHFCLRIMPFPFEDAAHQYM